MTSGSPSSSRRTRFGPFELDLGAGELRRDGVIIPLQPQPTRVLCYLAANAGHLVTRAELRDLLWPNTVVEFDHGLNTCIRQIRDALGERADAPVHVQTVPRRGYRFDVGARAEPTDGPSSPAHHERPPRAGRRLKWAGAATAVAAVAALAILDLPASTASARRVAVLPFQNLSPDRLPPQFVYGLTEDLIVELSRYRPDDLAVIASASTRRYAREVPTPREVGDALDATHLVTGTVRALGDTIEITAALVRIRDDVTVWSDRFFSQELEPMKQMGPLGRRVGSALVPPLRGDDSGFLARSSDKPEAERAFLIGRYLLAEQKPALARDHLDSAVRHDPGFALAHALLARARLLIGDTGGAAVAARTAHALAPALPEAHGALAEVAAQVRWDWQESLDAYRAALRLAPGHAELHQGYAFVLSLTGRHDEALREMELALALDPVSPLVNGDAAWLFLYAGRYGEAARQARATVALDAERPAAWYCLVIALEAAGALTQAQAVAADVAARYGAGAATRSAIERARPREGIDRFWRWDLEQMRANHLADRFPLEFAAAHVRFRRPDSALAYIERGIMLRTLAAPMIAVDPRFAPLRDRAAFAEALRRVGLGAERRTDRSGRRAVVSRARRQAAGSRSRGGSDPRRDRGGLRVPRG